MTSAQRKHIEFIIVLTLLFVMVWFLQDKSTLARLSFIPTGLYLLFNREYMRMLESTGPSPKEIFEQYKVVRIITIGVLAIEIFVSFYIVISGVSFGSQHIGFGLLTLIFMAPLFPSLVISQVHLYRRLAKL